MCFSTELTVHRSQSNEAHVVSLADLGGVPLYVKFYKTKNGCQHCVTRFDFFFVVSSAGADPGFS